MAYYSFFVHGATRKGEVVTEVVSAKNVKGAIANFRKRVSVKEAPEIIGVFERERILHPRVPITLRTYYGDTNRISPKVPKLR